MVNCYDIGRRRWSPHSAGYRRGANGEGLRHIPGAVRAPWSVQQSRGTGCRARSFLDN